MITLADRMKGYEDRSDYALTNRMPVIVRVDGKAFHTLTRGAAKPFDDAFMLNMDATAKYLATHMQNCVLAYTQSDEISLLLHNSATLQTEPWFANRLQKITSISASMAGTVFTLQAYIRQQFGISLLHDTLGLFDSRAFVIPDHDVNNYFVWRQKDAMRNSLQMLAQSLYTHKELQGVKSEQLQALCTNKGQDWNCLLPYHQRGRCYIRQDGNWSLDMNIPVFTANHSYIEGLLT